MIKWYSKFVLLRKRIFGYKRIDIFTEGKKMDIRERLSKLREIMASKNIDAYMVPSADFHQSEYVGEHFKARKFKFFLFF